MPSRSALPGDPVPDLYHRWGPGAESGKRFARLVDLLLYAEARRDKARHTIFDDRAGDYHGLDSFRDAPKDPNGIIGYQYKFFPSPLKADHRTAIEESLLQTAQSAEKIKLKTWILVTPQDLISPARSGDLAWFRSLHAKHKLPFALDHIGHKKLIGLFQTEEALVLCQHYYPELVPPELRPLRDKIAETRARYDRAFAGRHSRVTMVGFPTLRDTRDGFPIEQIYVPLSVSRNLGAVRAQTASEGAAREHPVNPVTLLAPGARSVIVGDPGSGKSTLLKFLALSGAHPPLQQRHNLTPDPEPRLPILVALRSYVDELKKPGAPDISLLTYIRNSLCADFSLILDDHKFLERYLETSQAILLFDGLDELADPKYKEKVRDRIKSLWETYPGNTVIVTSRIVGYVDQPFRFAASECGHYRLQPLTEPQIERFITDWYALRHPDDETRQREGVRGLMAVMRDPRRGAIRDLAENPLLLTLIAMVHRSEGTLPDKRAVLYEKCVELLLRTWHAWNVEGRDARDPSNTDIRNRRWLEEIANWMQESGAPDRREVAIKPYPELLTFLTTVVAKDRRIEEDEALDDATAFLKFVRERAGLLIETGDRQYSFVHLTFQEYLTASQRIRLIKRTSLKEQREKLLANAANTRWHEVIRLWIATLGDPESEEEAIRAILDRPGVPVALLAGGALLDSVEALDRCQSDILRRVLFECCQQDAEPSFAALESILADWLAKNAYHSDVLWSSLPPDVAPAHLALCLCCFEGLSPGRIAEWVTANVPRAEHLPFVVLLPGLTIPAEAEPDRKRVSTKLRAGQSYMLASGAGALPALVFPIESRIGELGGGRLFESALQALTGVGSFDRQLLHCALARARARDLARALDRTLDLDLAPDYIGTIWTLARPALWRTALRVQIVPRLSTLTLELANESTASSILHKLRQHSASSDDLSYAAWLILHAMRVGLYLGKSHLAGRLASFLAATKDHTHAALRIAHCINSIAEGHKNRIADLRAMINSDDPELKEIFVRACWRDP